MTEHPEKNLVENTTDQSRIAPASELYALTVPSPEVEPALTLPNGKFVTTLTLSSRTCRWPIGDPRDVDFHYCGRRPESGGKYCDSHERKSHQATRSRTNHQPPSFVRSR
jgi:hypothetical protein